MSEFLTRDTSLAAGDLNGDGWTDIVLGVNGEPSQVFLGTAGTPAYLAAPIHSTKVKSCSDHEMKREQ